MDLRKLIPIMFVGVLLLSGMPVSAEEHELKPGEDFSVAVEQVSNNVENEVAKNVFDIKLERNDSHAEEALEELEKELNEVHEERQKLVSQLQDGEISGREFAVKQAKLNVNKNSVAERMEHVKESSAEKGLDVAMKNVQKENPRNVSSYLEFAKKVSSGEISGQEVSTHAKELPGFERGPPENKYSPDKDISPGGEQDSEKDEDGVEDTPNEDMDEEDSNENPGNVPDNTGGPR